MAIVSAIGVDKNKDGKLVATFQIINPSNVAELSKGAAEQIHPSRFIGPVEIIYWKWIVLLQPKFQGICILPMQT